MATKRNNLLDLTVIIHDAPTENQANSLARRLISHRISTRIHNNSTLSYPVFQVLVHPRDTERSLAIRSTWIGEAL